MSEQTTSPTPERPGNRKSVDRPGPTTNVRRDGSRVDADERYATGSKPPPDA
jgi:hypothetical protein